MHLIGEINQNYAARNLPETIRLSMEVIRIEPRATAAWTTLALCYTEMGELSEALKCKIITAHLVHDVEKWIELGRDSRFVGFEFIFPVFNCFGRQLGLLQQAIYCFRKACTLDPTDVDAQWERGSVAAELGDLRTAKAAFLNILKNQPYDVVVLEDLRPILVESNEIKLGIKYYEVAFQYYMKQFPSGKYFESDGTEIVGGGFTDMQVIVLADFYNSVGDPEAAIRTIRKGARWLQGRGDQRWRDAEVDDREFDEEGFRRSDNTVAGTTRASFPLDVNLRHRLAVARLVLGDHEEGLVSIFYSFWNPALKNLFFRCTRGSFCGMIHGSMRYCSLSSPMQCSIKGCPRMR